MQIFSILGPSLTRLSSEYHFELPKFARCTAPHGAAPAGASIPYSPNRCRSPGGPRPGSWRYSGRPSWRRRARMNCCRTGSRDRSRCRSPDTNRRTGAPSARPAAARNRRRSPIRLPSNRGETSRRRPGADPFQTCTPAVVGIGDRIDDPGQRRPTGHEHIEIAYCLFHRDTHRGDPPKPRCRRFVGASRIEPVRTRRQVAEHRVGLDPEREARDCSQCSCETSRKPA